MDQLELIHLFYGYWQITVCTFAGIALLAIWHHITSRNALLQRDPGLLWLAVSVLIWGLVGGVEVLQVQLTDADELVFKGWKSLLSILNSTFILLALPRFRHVPRLILPILRSDSWRILVGLSFTFASLLTLLMLMGWVVPKEAGFVYIIDLIYAVFTLFFMGMMLWSSFEKRDLRLLAYLSVLTIAFTLLAQVLKLMGEPFYEVLFSGIFKSILITLFFALALSWVEELSNNQILPAQTQRLLFFQKYKENGKWINEVLLLLPPLIPLQKIRLTEKTYELLLKFARSRKAKSDAGWLEIQPKSSPTKTYDIRDYNEINRLLDGLLTGFDQPTDQKRKALKELLFEYGRQRHLRLKLEAEEIHLET